MVSLVTEGAIGAGTSSPDADLHVVGGPTLATLLLGPDEPSSGDDSELLLGEDDSASFGVKLRYDGGTNLLSVHGIVGGADTAAWMTIARDDGATSFTGDLSITDLSCTGCVDSFNVLDGTIADVDLELSTNSSNVVTFSEGLCPALPHVCPSGSAIAGGAEVTSDPCGQAVLESSYPSAVDTWTASVCNQDELNPGCSDTVSFKTWVVCVG